MSEKTFTESKLIFSNDFKQDTYKILEITKELADELEEKKGETKYFIFFFFFSVI